ncbi:MAG: hypothetical protein PWQ57_294 [Desulfovibrionales bacterium]|nr:hypothetical protein [Desulfovibrionales bacterium]
MPGFDGSGPNGQGPMSGRGMGYCAAGAGREPGFGRGRGCGRGRGLGQGQGQGLGRGLGGRRAAGAWSDPAGEPAQAGRLEQVEAELARLKEELGRKD